MTRADKQTGEPYSTFNENARSGVRLERRLEATPEEVWSLLIDPEEAATWLTTLDIEPRVGGVYTLSFENGMPTSQGHITAFEPPTLLEFSWYEGRDIESRVRFELRADAGATILNLTHTLLHDTDDLEPYAEGWTYHLGRLSTQLEARAAVQDKNELRTVIKEG